MREHPVTDTDVMRSASEVDWRIDIDPGRNHESSL
jgi:hypothetical protein